MAAHPKETKHPKFGHLPLSTSGPQDCALEGSALLQTPYLNKGSAFTPEERNLFKLHSLLPPSVQTLENQVHRAYEQFKARTSDIAKNTFMTSLKDQNEVLYFKVATETYQGEFTADHLHSTVDP